jgi:hypothetical protein
MKKKKQKTLRQLKDICWRLFSEWIRRSHADEGGTVSCITCGRLMFWRESQCGHFVGGRTGSVLFVEAICFPQCCQCNIFAGGNYAVYTLRMLDMYGREKVDEFLALKNRVVKFTRSDLEEKIEMYKRKLETLNA